MDVEQARMTVRAEYSKALIAAVEACFADDSLDLDAEFASRIPAHLREYWIHGKGAAKVRWCTKGAFRRAQRLLRKYVPRHMVDGLVANLYHAACGYWPGRHSRKGK